MTTVLKDEDRNIITNKNNIIKNEMVTSKKNTTNTGDDNNNSSRDKIGAAAEEEKLTFPESQQRIEILTLIDAYHQVHELGEDHTRSSLWNIYKARHLKQRNALVVQTLLQADDIRSELRARSVVRLQGWKKKNITATVEQPQGNRNNNALSFFTLVDIVEEKVIKNQKEKKNVPTASSSSDAQDANDIGTFGLRNRKKGKGEKVPELEEEWTITEEKQQENSEDEEIRLRNANPIDFFAAMPPKELRTAQEEARKALGFYVEAANMIMAIQYSLQSKKN